MYFIKSKTDSQIHKNSAVVNANETWGGGKYRALLFVFEEELQVTYT